MKITSATNPRIKQIVRLRNRKDRSVSQLILVDGIREVKQARQAGVKIKELYTCPEFYKERGSEGFIQEMVKEKVPLNETTPEVFQKISFGDRREGILAVCQSTQRNFSDITLSNNPLIVVVERIEKPGNLGAIFRTCDGAGIDVLIVSDSTTDINNPNTIRASLGTVFTVPVVQKSQEEVLKFLREKNVKIIATSPIADKIYSDTNMKEPFAIIVGSEQEGLSDFWMQHSDVHVKIPMKGQADSLNVSSSTAILLYEAVRQRTL